MSQKNQKTLPISQNAYKSFVNRINAVSGDKIWRKNMTDALDRYLDGDRKNYAADLDKCSAMAFEMLRFEIDKAMERSARARRPRKSNKKDNGNGKRFAKFVSSLMSDLKIDDEDESQDATSVPPGPSRRQRRAFARTLRPKSKWRKIG